MSSAETTHAVEWRDDGYGGEESWKNGTLIGLIFPHYDPGTRWGASIPTEDGVPNSWRPYHLFPTASDARAFVERTVREAGHGE